MCIFFLKVFFGLAFCASFMTAEVSSNKFELQALSSTKGLIGHLPFGNENRSASNFSFELTPFSVSASTANNNLSEKTTKYLTPGSTTDKIELGVLEDHGFWNAAGIFYGFTDQAHAENIAHTIDTVNYSPAIFYAPQGLALNTISGSTMVTGLGNLPESTNALIHTADWTATKYGNYYKAFLTTAFGLSEAGFNSLSNTASVAPYTSLNNQDVFKNNLYPKSNTFQTPGESDLGVSKIIFSPKMDKRGMRAQLSVEFLEGICFKVKGGVAELKVSPTTRMNLVKLATTTNSAPNAAPVAVASDFGKLETVLNDLDLTLQDYTVSSFEDTYASVCAGQTFLFKDYDGDSMMSAYPFVAAGVWMPTSKNYEKAEGSRFAFYVPVGNEGHTGISFNAGVSLNILGAFCCTLGGGGTWFNEISIKDYRMANHALQTGLYPFKIDISRRKGRTYFGHLSGKSVNFDDGASVYFDYVYAVHEHDKYLLKDSSTARNNAFEGGKATTERRSAWVQQEFNAGLTYNVAQDVTFGMGCSLNAGGVSAPRMKTIYGNLAFIF